jgi:hypothetical protein
MFYTIFPRHAGNSTDFIWIAIPLFPKLLSNSVSNNGAPSTAHYQIKPIILGPLNTPSNRRKIANAVIVDKIFILRADLSHRESKPIGM